MVTAVKLNKEAFDGCMKYSKTDTQLAQEVERGNLANVQGTPTVFVNGKVLTGGFMIVVLEAALKLLGDFLEIHTFHDFLYHFVKYK